jgi:serine protease
LNRTHGIRVIRRWRAIVFALVAVVTLARAPESVFGAAAGGNEPAASRIVNGSPGSSSYLQPRFPPSKPRSIRVPARGVRRDVVIVKLAEGSEIRLRGRDFHSLQSSPSESFKVSLLRLNELAHRPKIRHVRRYFSRPEAELDTERRNGEHRSRRQLADLNLYYTIQLDSGSDPGPVLADLNALPIVEIAYLEPVPEPAAIPSRPAAEVASTPDYESRQNCLADTSTGVHALYGWTQPGGTGSGVRIVDIEGGWQDTHEDFPSPFTPIDGTNSTDPGWRQHGTAVLGEMVGVDNGVGVSGIARDARFSTVSILSYSTSNAISRASGKLSAGDVIVVELHAPGPASGLTCSCNCSQFEYVPMEYWMDVYDAIRTATANGRIVVEAAGNGSMDLDSPLYGGAFDRSQRDSGAILVGAGVSSNRTPHCWTNYGSRVDLQGWGNGVVTTGYGDLFDGTQDGGTDDPDRYYTSSFSGTSSATPIVAGSAAAIQGRYRAITAGGVLSPGTLRDLIRDTGTPQGTSGNFGNKQIGPLPNIEEAMIGLDPAAPLPPSDLAATPGGWSKTDSFEIDWTNPSHPSAIAGAYYKIGSPPTSDTDGLFTTVKPISVTATAQGGQPVFVWLKDVDGNSSYLYRSSTTLRWDATPPSPEITSPTSDPVYTTTDATINLGGLALDGFSGIVAVTWSNDRGGNGTADGTVSWIVPDISLSVGANVIIVTARDGANNTGTDTITVTREAPDTTPDPFAFVSQIGVPRSTGIESNVVTVSGINMPTAISIAGGGGQYRIDGGTYAVAPGTVAPGQTVQVRLTSSGAYSSTVMTTLTVGGIAASFSLTTLAPPFDFSISATPASVTAGNSTGSSITATLVSGETTAVTFLGPALAGTAFSWSASPVCNPTCTRILNIATSPSTPIGAHTLIVSADGGGIERSASFILTVNPPTCVLSPPGMLSWWPADDNANDIVGGDTGVLQGKVEFTDGMVGSAFWMDGADGRVLIPDRPDLQSIQAISIDTWVKASPTGAGQSLIGKFNHNSGSPGNPADDSYELGLTSSGGLTWRVETVGGAAVDDNILMVSSINLFDDSYHHIAATYDGLLMTLYLDGVLVGSKAANGTIAYAGTAMMLGASLDNGVPSFFLNGSLDEVEVFNRVLSASEIQSIFLAGVAGTCRPGSPTVTTVGPAGDETGVALNQSISATFSIAMDPATVNPATFYLNHGLSGAITYDPATRTATLEPLADMIPFTVYTATITTGAKNLLGKGLASDYVWSFTTGAAPDTTPPGVISTSPPPGAADVAVNSPITATFSEAMTSSTINESTFMLLRPNNTEVAGTVFYDFTTRTARFTPLENLENDAVYRAVLDAGIQDAFGNPMGLSYEWSFATARQFTMSATIANPMGGGTIVIRTSAGDILNVSGSDAAAYPGMPLGIRFPYGLVGIRIAGLAPGETITLTIVFPGALPAGTAWYWHNPGSADWVEITGAVDWTGPTATWNITDGGIGDSDAMANGVIDDPLGPAVNSSAASTAPQTQDPSSSGHCFIATAAYGSYLDPHVRVLRKFRDRYMLTNGPGRRLVQAYYHYSPPLADYIRRHEPLRTAVRWTLTPFVYLLEFPKTGFLLMAAGALLCRFGRRKRRPRLRLD